MGGRRLDGGWDIVGGAGLTAGRGSALGRGVGAGVETNGLAGRPAGACGEGDQRRLRSTCRRHAGRLLDRHPKRDAHWRHRAGLGQARRVTVRKCITVSRDSEIFDRKVADAAEVLLEA